MISVALVLMVVAIFMRRLIPTMAAAVTVPLSISGTLGAMYLLGYSLNNFSLMALTISVGFVVDDAIVMIENIYRFQERGMTPLEAAFAGATADRLHRHLDQRLARRRLHTDHLHGRPARPFVSTSSPWC